MLTLSLQETIEGLERGELNTSGNCAKEGASVLGEGPSRGGRKRDFRHLRVAVFVRTYDLRSIINAADLEAIAKGPSELLPPKTEKPSQSFSLSGRLLQVAGVPLRGQMGRGAELGHLL